jgi:putative membrane-bound dehydrogenase-like protein
MEVVTRRHIRRSIFFLATTLPFAWLFACGFAARSAEPPADLFTQPLSPPDSLAQMVVRPGLRVELVAAEPLVADPVAFAWGPDGKFWVIEMGDYPLGIDGRGAPGGRVKWLADDDGDGRFDRSTTFLDAIPFPTAVQPWRGGVIVCAVPEIFFAADTDGDGRADRREPFYTGLKTGNSQHLANGLRWGPDGWLHCANGGTNTSVRSVKLDQVVEVGSRDFRIRPATGEIETLAGRSQFVRDCDDWGNWFGSTNSEPLFHFVLDERYTRRNLFAANPPPAHIVTEIPGAAPVFPISRTVSRFNELNRAGRFTSACGLTIYRDTLLGDEYYGNAFICEPVHNLVHREIVTRDGVSFRSRRADDERRSEFLASRDPWFRPTMARTGPDGALYIADMYRLVIEHPEWIPKDWQAKLDLRAGSDRGRIYRIVPEKGSLRTVPRLDGLAVADLIELLDTPSGTLRDLVMQQLIDDEREETKLEVRRVARYARTAFGRFALMSISAARGDARAGTISLALDETAPELRGAAILLAPTGPEHAALENRLVTEAADADAGVRMRAALRLGEVTRPDAAAALGKLLVHAGNDRYVRAAVQSSLTKRGLFAVVRAALEEAQVSKLNPAPTIESLVDTVAGYDDRPSLALLLRAAVEVQPPGDRPAVAATLLDGLARHKISVESLRSYDDAGLRSRVDELAQGLQTARRTVDDRAAPEADRIASLAVFGREATHRSEEIEILDGLLTATTPEALQDAAVAACTKFAAVEAVDLLLSRWIALSPAQKQAVLAACLNRATWAARLVAAVAEKRITASEIDVTTSQQLTNHPDAKVREAAAQALTQSIDPDRAAVVARYVAAVTSPSGDAGRGREVFKKSCSACHQAGDVGQAIGPDLTALSDRSPAAMLTSMLDPNRAVESKFFSYTAVTDAGLTLVGLLVGESDATVTLAAADGKRHTLRRDELEQFVSSGRSFMPVGLEKDVSPEQAADVLAFLEASRAPAKSFPGNQPRIVQPDALWGAFYLTADAGAAFGDTLTFAADPPRFTNWKSANDRVEWDFEITTAGVYDVTIEYACPRDGGGTFVVDGAGSRFTGKAEPTAGRDDFRSVLLGRVALEPGRRRIVVRSSGVGPSSPEPVGELFDLASMKLRRR